MTNNHTWWSLNCNYHLNLGPLVLSEDKGPFDGIATLIGISSWGAACGFAEYPDVYAKVSLALDWINKETGNMTKLPYNKQRAEIKCYNIYY